MISVVGGEDNVSSRNKLNELLSDKKNIIRLDGKKNSVVELDEALSSGSLFSDSKTIVVEYFTKLKPEDKFFELLEKSQGTEILLWDEADLAKKKFPKSFKIFNFQFPKYYFAFLDSFEPNSKKSIELLLEVLKTFESEQILYGLIRRIRQLLVLKSNDYSEFSDFKKMGDWQFSKVKKQANLWREDQLKKVFLELAELDEKLKTSSLTMPLAKHLDIVLLSDLN